MILKLSVQIYLKEILSDICLYRGTNPYKNTWELKPEYRCYKNDSGEKKEEAKAEENEMEEDDNEDDFEE